MNPRSLWLRLPIARGLRIAGALVLMVVTLCLAALIIHQVIFPLVVAAVPALRSCAYDLAVYGIAPTRRYHSLAARSPEPSVLRWHDRCDDDGLLFLGPYGASVPTPGATVLDARGDLVWTTTEYGYVINLQMQHFAGRPYLTFWSGDKDGSVGRGTAYMLDDSYRRAYTVNAVGANLMADLHEFEITADGTALITVYNDTTADLSSFSWFRDEHGWVADCIFQEIDIVTGQLVFQWVASEHVDLRDTHYFQPFSGFDARDTYDYYHLNSVVKDSRGNYLISSRHFHAITYIDGRSGDILWVISKHSPDFVDVSDGRATDFKWSHHARWVDEDAGIISLFDNGVAGPLHLDSPHSKGTMIQIDRANRTVRHLRDFHPLQNVRSHSQGGLQVLPNRDVLVGWGSSAMWSQFDPDGTLLCEVHFGASLLYYWEWVKSYRVFKFWGWVGRPREPPAVVLDRDTLYVSWNGATEVRFWRLQGQPRHARGQAPPNNNDGDDDAFQTIETAPKRGFEHAFALPARHHDFWRYRVAALDADRVVLDHSPVVEWEATASVWPPACAVIAVVAALLAYARWMWTTRRDTSSSSSPSSPLHNFVPWRRCPASEEPLPLRTYVYSKL